MEQKDWKVAKNKYQREWFKRHPEKRLLYQVRYWSKKLKELEQK